MVLPYCRHSGVCASSPFSQAQEGFPGGGFAKLTPLLNRPKTWSTVPSSLLLASSCSTHSLRLCLAFFLASQKCLFVETDLPSLDNILYIFYGILYISWPEGLRLFKICTLKTLWNIHSSTFQASLVSQVRFPQPWGALSSREHCHRRLNT